MTVPKLKVLLVAVLAAGALAAGGCGEAAAPQPAAAVAAGVPAALAFTGKTLDGTAFDAASLAGRPAILWFWAPWCATCAAESMSITNLRTTYGADRLAILGIAGMGGNAEMRQFVADLEVGEVTHLDDQPGTLWKKFGITQQSTYVILDRTGHVDTTAYLDDLQLTAKVKSLVA